MSLEIKSKIDCEYDLVCHWAKLCFVWTPCEGRIRTAKLFRMGRGGEYNVARGLRRCFGMDTGVVTAFADNEIGRLIEDFILQGRSGYISDQVGSL